MVNLSKKHKNGKRSLAKPTINSERMDREYLGLRSIISRRISIPSALNSTMKTQISNSKNNALWEYFLYQTLQEILFLILS